MLLLSLLFASFSPGGTIWLKNQSFRIPRKELYERIERFQKRLARPAFGALILQKPICIISAEPARMPPSSYLLRVNLFNGQKKL